MISRWAVWRNSKVAKTKKKKIKEIIKTKKPKTKLNQTKPLDSPVRFSSDNLQSFKSMKMDRTLTLASNFSEEGGQLTTTRDYRV